LPQIIDHFESVRIIGDAEVGPYLFSFDIPRKNTQQDVRLVFKLLQKAHFDIRIIARQHPGCMIVVQQFSAEFEVKFVVGHLGPLQNFSSLFFQVFIVVKSRRYRHWFLHLM